MLDYIHFENYRGFSNLKLENLKPINIIVGSNNVGKTGVLEGIGLAFAAKSSNSLPQLFRKTPSKEEKSAFWDWLVYKGAEQQLATIACHRRGSFWLNSIVASGSSELKSLKSNLPNANDLESHGFHKVAGYLGPKMQNQAAGGGWERYDLFYWDGDVDQAPPDLNVVARPTADAEPESVSKLYNQIAPLNPDGEDEIQGFLKNSIEPRLKRIRYALAKDTKTHLAYVQLEGLHEMIPFTQLGQAFSSTFHLYCLLYAERPDILLIDEIENGIYFEGLGDYWKGLHAALAAKKTQLFATTHSFECMKAAHEEAKKLDGEYPINFIRLQRDPDDASKIIATEFGEEAMDGAIQQGWDMR